MLQSVLDLLHQLAQVSQDAFGLVTAASVVIAWISVHFHFKNKYAATIANACLVAEKALDSVAYNGGAQIDQTRLALAVSMVHMAFPKLDEATISKDITEYVTGIHNVISNLPPTQQGILDDFAKVAGAVEEEVKKVRKKPRVKPVPKPAPVDPQQPKA